MTTVHLKNPECGEIIVRGEASEDGSFEMERAVWQGRDITKLAIAYDLVERIQGDCEKTLLEEKKTPALPE